MTKAGVHRVSVNSFGFGGTNVHAILDSAEEFLANGHDVAIGDKQISSVGSRFSISHGLDHEGNGDVRYRVFVLSTLDEPSLKAAAQNMVSYIKRRAPKIPNSFLNDLAYTLNFERSLFPYRSAVSANSIDGLIKAIENPSRLPMSKVNANEKPPSVGFVFTGQGAQWAVWAKKEIERDGKTSSIARGKFSQPLCTALQVSLFELLGSWGIRPTAAAGHSSGEIASAYTDGIISREDAMASAYHREICSERSGHHGQERHGQKGVHDAHVAVSEPRREPAVHPSNVTISGDDEAIVEYKERLDRDAIFARILIVEAAYHSLHMEAVRDEYLHSTQDLYPKRDSDPDTNLISFYSSVTGKRAEPTQLGPQYWVENMMGRVEFASSLKALAIESEIDTLLEVGPHAALAGPVKQILQASDRLRGVNITYASVLKIKESAAKPVVAMAVTLATKGVPVDLRAVHGTTTTSAAVVTGLPSYPWNKSRSYWAESRLSREFRNCPYPRRDLLGRPAPNFNPLDGRWRNFVRTVKIPWLRDHRIESKIVYPAVGYIAMAMAIEAVKQRAPRAPSAYRLREIVFGKALITEEEEEENDDDDTEVFMSLRARNDGTRKPSSTVAKAY
ncbi:Putative Acyl transferase domain superfamily, Acyl transferase/acyl hydrolase/lysophospholipase [Colletotrichum destructivum]|uniref:Acyl transferase domain superfamily, Acyl transferase/acyl hydrolase/lysophospholipase n=1 Tax=Colletotrichum destructivum TaxID=34406 RepID=A0AAX4HWG6_9PEZI|nr:Putative Acyl transferase domain superfamily, Acyl transferase/acyl hydrolase/lysophospholipase [Colletotrichum destructivum]